MYIFDYQEEQLYIKSLKDSVFSFVFLGEILRVRLPSSLLQLKE